MICHSRTHRQAMLDVLLLLKEKYNLPKPVTEPLTGKTILLTGATTGLGLEAAKKIAALRPDKLIITARDPAKGAKAKEIIENRLKETTPAKGSVSTEIYVLELDQSDFASVKLFAQNVESKFPHLDAVILNAALTHQQWQQTKDGWEDTLQVNAISTTLLALRLLPILKSSAKAGSEPTHLTFVSSGSACNAPSKPFEKFYNSTNALRQISQKESWLGSFQEYQASKVLLEYCMRHVAQLPTIQSESGRGPSVIINSVCPGMCKSKIGREASENKFFALALSVLYFLLGRPPEEGVNIYLSGITQGVDSHGEMWKNDIVYPMGTMHTTAEGKQFGNKIWAEMVEVVQGIDPRVKEVLSPR